MTPAQEAMQEGFQALAEAFDPDATWSFNSNSFAAVPLQLAPDTPQLPGNGERTMAIEAWTADLPTERPVRGDDLTHAGRQFRIVRKPEDNEATGRTIFVLAQ